MSGCLPEGGPIELLERERVLRAAESLTDAARLGRGGALFVVGAPGLGKTSLLEVASARLGSAFRVGRGCADPMEASLPFGLLHQALDGLSAGAVFADEDTDRAASDARARRFYALFRWLENVRLGPLLIAVDDLHWADPDSVALLLFLCRRIRRLPVAVLGTLRPWPSAAHEACARLARAGLARIEWLAPLSTAGAGSLLAARLGHRLTESEARRVSELCAGNPLLLEQVAASIQRGEDVGRRGGGPDVSKDLLLPRFAGLPAPALRCIQAGSVLGTRFQPELAVEMAGLADVEKDPALDALQHSGLVRHLAGSWVEFVHPLFRQALYDDLPSARRARAHARAFATLARRGRDAEATEHAARSDLVGDDEALAVLRRAGRSAIRAGALESAVTHLSSAVDIAGGSVNPDLLLTLGELLLALGRSREAIAIFERLEMTERAPPLIRVQALRLLARCHYGLGATDRASLSFAAARELATRLGADAEVPILLDHALAGWITDGPTRSLPLAERACRLTDASERATRRARAVAGFIRLLSGDPSQLDALATAAHVVETVPLADLAELSYTWSAASGHALAAAFTERFGEAEKAFRAGLHAAERVGAVEAMASLRLGYAYSTLLRLGRLQEALDLVDKVSELAELVPLIEMPSAFAHAYVLLMMGRLEESDAWWRQGDLAAGDSKNWWPRHWGWHVRGLRCLRQGRLDEAADQYLRIEAETTRLGIGEPCVLPWARHAIAVHARRGRVADAERVIEWLEHRAEKLPCRWPRIAAATGRGWLAEMTGDRALAHSCFQAALAEHEHVQLPLERIETLFAYGAFLRRSGSPARARPPLREALNVAEQLGAHWLARQAREELTVAGGRRRRRDEQPQLTAQEQRVADLAAMGLTNSDIAGLLSISVKTVEFHLQRIYSKLGIRSRRQLITTLATGPITNRTTG